jgi:hypothetical protein
MPTRLKVRLTTLRTMSLTKIAMRALMIWKIIGSLKYEMSERSKLAGFF